MPPSRRPGAACGSSDRWTWRSPGCWPRWLSPLAEARVNIVAFSTYDTDYLLVPAVRLSEALDTLTAVGHRIAA
nr:hypothetical protein GCM10020092_003360 [Actinoplanes digitatis]